jgi:hypothetical protein
MFHSLDELGVGFEKRKMSMDTNTMRCAGSDAHTRCTLTRIYSYELLGLVLFPKVSEEVQAASRHFPTLDPCIRKVADDVLIRCVECAKELYSRLGDSRTGAARGILTDQEQEK